MSKYTFTKEECEIFEKSDRTKSPRNNRKLQVGKAMEEALYKQCLKKSPPKHFSVKVQKSQPKKLSSKSSKTNELNKYSTVKDMKIFIKQHRNEIGITRVPTRKNEIWEIIENYQNISKHSVIKTSNIEAIVSVLEFMKEHPRLIMGTNPYALHLMENLYLTKNIKIKKWGCCMNIPPLICDILRLKAPRYGKIVKLNKMKPGNYYFLECMDHDTSIIYLKSDLIYSVEYYEETGRPNFFRVKKITDKDILAFEKAVETGNIEEYANYFDGNEKFIKDLYKHVDWIRKNSLVDKVYEQSLSSSMPEIKDILRVVLKTDPSFPFTDFDGNGSAEFYVEEDFEKYEEGAIQKARKYYNQNINELKSVIENTFLSKKIPISAHKNKFIVNEIVVRPRNNEFFNVIITKETPLDLLHFFSNLTVYKGTLKRKEIPGKDVWYLEKSKKDEIITYLKNSKYAKIVKISRK